MLHGSCVQETAVILGRHSVLSVDGNYAVERDYTRWVVEESEAVWRY